MWKYLLIVIVALGFLLLAILASDGWKEWKKEWRNRTERDEKGNLRRKKDVDNVEEE